METKTSFDLNRAVRRWRDALRASPEFSEPDLEELEGHLRESHARLEGAGLSSEEAFLVAVRRLGGGDALAQEYGGVHRQRVWIDRVIWMVLGTVGVGVLANAGQIILGIALLLLRPALGLENRIAVVGMSLVVCFGTVIGAGYGLWILLRDETLTSAGWLASMTGRPIAAGVAVGLVSFLLMAANWASVAWMQVWSIDSRGFAEVMATRNLTAAMTMGIWMLAWPASLAWLLSRRRRISA